MTLCSPRLVLTKFGKNSPAAPLGGNGTGLPARASQVGTLRGVAIRNLVYGGHGVVTFRPGFRAVFDNCVNPMLDYDEFGAFPSNAYLASTAPTCSGNYARSRIGSRITLGAVSKLSRW